MTTLQAKTQINSVQRAANSVRRAAFTLVELMIVILIIGILVGIATPVIFTAMRTAKEFTITSEVQQMNASIEKFKTEHGFYPPAIGPGLEIDTDTPAVAVPKFLRYLNRIAPNHAEAGNLAAWWTAVGSNLDQDSSLVFWLSGLCTSKQFPLSGNATLGAPLAPYNANKFSTDVDFNAGVTIDRNVFFEFKSAQLVNAEPPLASDPPLPNGIKVYHQPQGKGDDLAYRYRDFKSYGASTAYHLVDPSTSAITFMNPTTFQIVGPGMDGTIFDPNATIADTNLVDSTDPTQDDNITNFSNGRLEKSYE